MQALYIDTEVMFQDLELRRAGFSLLRAKLTTTNAVRLLVSEVVLLESTNHYRRSLEKSLIAYEKAVKDLRSLLPEVKVDDSPDPSTVNFATSEYGKRIRETLKSFGAQIVPLPNISHRQVVERAISKRRPFDENGRGFNDVMIWLSLVNFLRTNTFDKVILVTNNTKDFAKDGVVLDDLAQDLRYADIVTSVQHCPSIHDALRILFGAKSAPISDLERDKEWQRSLIASHLHNIANAVDDGIQNYMLAVTTLGEYFEIVAVESAMVEANTASLGLVVRFSDVVLTRLKSTARWDIFTTHNCELDCRLEIFIDPKSRQLLEPVIASLIYVDRIGPATSRKRERITP
jgi:hypothetical protein